MAVDKETAVLGLTGFAMVLLGSGFGVAGYIYTSRKLKAKYEALSQQEIAEAREYYKTLHKAEEFSDPTTLLESYGSREIEADGYDPIEEDIDPTERSLAGPYVISQNEFVGADLEYDQRTITYYEEEDILTDEQDKPFLDVENVVGVENLTKFGKGTRDNNIVYIRNDSLAVDFEVIRSKGNYAKDVLGVIEHSEPRGRPRKFRRDYE